MSNNKSFFGAILLVASAVTANAQLAENNTMTTASAKKMGFAQAFKAGDKATNNSGINISVGGRFGYGFATATAPALSNIAKPTYLTVYSGGLVAEIGNSKVSFQPELNYTEKGFALALSKDLKLFGLDLPLNVRADTRTRYLEMPLMGKIKFGDPAGVQGYITAGPTVGYALSGNVKAFTTTLIEVRLLNQDLDLAAINYKRFELGGAIGAGVQYSLGDYGRIYVDGRFSRGFQEVYEVPLIGAKVRNQRIDFSIGYAYPIQ